MYNLPVLTNIQNELLERLKKLLSGITSTSIEYKNMAKKHWDSIAKPLDSLGEFEKIFQKISAISENEIPNIDKKCITVMCADNGIVEEGISQSGKEVTLAVTKSMALGTSSISVLCKSTGSDLMIIDMGIDSFGTDIYSMGVINHKLMHGTNNFSKEKAMPFDITLRALLTGIEIVENLKESHVSIIGTGEMGIGNTTTSSALSAALLDLSVGDVTGRGAGLNNIKLKKKIDIIDKSINKYGFRDKLFLDSIKSKDLNIRIVSILDLLSSLGGLDIAALTGVFLGSAIYKSPVVIDGVISEVAALLAYFINPLCQEYMIASHLSREPVAGIIFDVLGLNPVIEASLALGEGSGCAMLFSLLDLIANIYTKNASFSDIKIEEYKRFV
ncbi:nicotinate-nucleotide--dimethylbenzimidazole phosphoribosyltransferase [Lachnoanaerobaculum umeaense]|jgi:nicotinate-nucleotide--dimethylbenzimidazole phosphoribosyltransferase|uniref:Nicotinate-nucleotide--dimethylbenzimidazole phosphoribosyltransferase n=1 Tax=Lachnoanaerobaculum umeaense TaxID=617123 RepID=A0A385PZL6_9FIRM|nr:nicotinate-nucleotide--dimethylbenzimidazole phosphoribosyltransferase [Lachnoanaerobaculum umeaense]AYA99570.1 nicotinate-nucleotide--dimethylbenzimidazole phosphoribosyltransferase [Lachnoanaerobaculum umeaense]PZW96495.1 nicotinate-nucleotide-dimethylbenzimidazole phosphoribosyltransferase [Lachnoanaerobaculum umeaense]